MIGSPGGSIALLERLPINAIELIHFASLGGNRCNGFFVDCQCCVQDSKANYYEDHGAGSDFHDLAISTLSVNERFEFLSDMLSLQAWLGHID